MIARTTCTAVGVALFAVVGTAGADPAWSSLDALDQYQKFDDGNTRDYDVDYLADALGPKLTETGRLGYLVLCVKSKSPVQWAMCQADVAAYDAKKVAAEVDADKTHSANKKADVKQAAEAMTEKLKEHATKVKAKMAEDPAWAKMFEIATSTQKDWDGIAKNDAALLDLALLMDDARVTKSRRAAEGCDAKTWAAWKDAVGGIPAKKFATVHDTDTAESLLGAMAVVANDPEGYLAASAHYSCHAGDEKEKDALLRHIGESLHRWPGFRGPRNAIHTALLTAGLQLDQRDAKIDFPSVSREWFERNGGWHSWGKGVVGKLKPEGDKAHLEFAKAVAKQWRCLSEKKTNRIHSIRSDGSLDYEIDCLKSAMVNVDVTMMPQTLNTRYTQGLKPGMQVTVIEDVAGVVWPKPGAPAPSMIGGVAVK
jgi:hypothetical protein